VEHPVWDAERGALRVMEGRVRLCPYYIVEEDRPVLRGALATIVPVDKKLIHGMADAAMVPVRMEPSGS
jgi:hypothetical protein